MGNGASMSPREDDGVRYKGGSVPEPTNVEGAWLQKALRLIRSDTYDAFSELLRKATRDNKEGSRKKRLSDAAWVAMLREAAAHGSICSLELLRCGEPLSGKLLLAQLQSSIQLLQLRFQLLHARLARTQLALSLQELLLQQLRLGRSHCCCRC